VSSQAPDLQGFVLRTSNVSLTLQIALLGIVTACSVVVAATSSTINGRLVGVAGTLLFGYLTWLARTRGRSQHEFTSETLKIRSFGVSRDVPVQSIAGVGLIQTELKSTVASYRAWQPFVWDVDGEGLRLRGITVLERRRSDLKLLRTRPGRVAMDLFQRIADSQGPSGPLLQHHVQVVSVSPPSIIELLPGSRKDEPRFRRWNPGTHWQPENT